MVPNRPASGLLLAALAGGAWAAGCAVGSASRPDAEPAPGPEADPMTTVAPLPLARRGDTVETLHGRVIPDPYRWLEDEDAPEVQAFMDAHDARARAWLEEASGRADYLERLRALAYVDARSAPVVRGSRTFWSEKPADREKAIHYWREGEGEPQVLVDPLVLAPDGTLALGAVVPSPEGRFVAYLEKPDNADESILKVMDVATGTVRPGDTIEGLRYTTPSWLSDGSGFYYTWIPSDPAIPENERMGYGEVRFHRLGTDPGTDETVREKTGDPTRWQGAEVSDDGRWLFVSVTRGWSESEVYVRDRADPDGDWIHLTERAPTALYFADGHGDRIFVRTNAGAPRYRLFAVEPGRYARSAWKEIIPEDEQAVLDDVRIFGGHLVVHALRRAASELRIHGLDGALVREVPLDAVGTVTGLGGRADQAAMYVDFESFDRPQEIWRTVVATGETSLFHRTEAPSTPGALEVEQVRYPSKDGTEISMFLVRRPGTPKDGARPTLLYGYGGFNISLTPEFSALVVAWVESGGIYAMPNLRGGGEYGESWHQAGMLDRKQNVFDDLIGAAKWLVESGWTSPRHLGIRGGSNGGLLVGAAMTQRPDLFRAVVCAVPLLDMVRYHRFGIGRAWIPEYGTAENPEDLAWLLAYSPYHRVEKGTAYPALLMLSADHDDRVDPMHARKFVAQVRWADAGDRPTLLRIETHSGHGGGDLRKKWVTRTADELAFLREELFGPSSP